MCGAMQMRTNERPYNTYKRNPKARNFYNSLEWRKMRAYIFKRDTGLCQKCLEDNKITKGDVVHHKVELLDGETGWNKRLDPNNLITLCHEHHNIIHKTNGDVLNEGLMFDSNGFVVKK